MHLNQTVLHIFSGVTQDVMRATRRPEVYIHVGEKLRELNLDVDPVVTAKSLVDKTAIVNGMYIKVLKGETGDTIRVVPAEPALDTDFLKLLTQWAWEATIDVGPNGRYNIHTHSLLLALGYVVTPEFADDFVTRLIEHADTVSLPFCSVGMEKHGSRVAFTWSGGVHIRNRDVAIHLEHLRNVLTQAAALSVDAGDSRVLNVGQVMSALGLKLTRKACTTTTRFVRVSPARKFTTATGQSYEVSFAYSQGHGNVLVTVETGVTE